MVKGISTNMWLKIANLILFVTLAFGFITYCSDGKKAVRSGIVTGLNDYHQRIPLCLPGLTFPERISIQTVSQYPEKIGVLDYLVSQKMVTKSVTNEPLKRQSSGVAVNSNPPLPIYRFDLTPAGKRHYQASSGLFLASKGRICVGNEEVVKLDKFTGPQDMAGKKIAEVEYSTHLNIEPWANHDIISRYFKIQHSAAKKKAVMILTSKGWVHKEYYTASVAKL